MNFNKSYRSLFENSRIIYSNIYLVIGKGRSSPPFNLLIKSSAVILGLEKAVSAA
jgi:hypothetical protein